jgi:hypothetical protein
MTDQTKWGIPELHTANKARKHEADKQVKIDKLSELLADMIEQADEDTPSEYRTKHFRNTMTRGIDYLKKIGFYE